MTTRTRDVAGPDVPFLRSGRSSLDLVWTLRFRRVQPTETLTDVPALARWLRETFPAVDGVEKLARPALLADVRRLREAVHASVAATIDGRPLAAGDLELVNAYAARPRIRWQLAVGHGRVAHQVTRAALLSELATDAVEVLARPERLRACEGPSCALPFLDTSRGGTRRWCTAQRCGNRVNTRAYRTRRGAG